MKPVDFHSCTKSSKNVSATTLRMPALSSSMISSQDWILWIALPLIPFLRKGSTRAMKLKLLRITETSRTETSFNGTDDDAAGDCNYKGTDDETPVNKKYLIEL
jgi:hypothetical protein